jgi:hypothetical protein
MGEANQQTLELIRNWCAHIRVDKQGGGGLVEQFTSLPIGPRSLACPHAVAPGFSGHDLRFLAVDFHDRNCLGCSHRKPVGFPNLSTLIQQRDAARAASDEEGRRREAAAAEALQERDAARQAIRAGLPPPSADVIDQIEELDHKQRDSANADRLVETARLAPEVFTAPVLAYAFELIEAGETWFYAAGLSLLRVLNTDAPRLTRCALRCLPRRIADEIAADIVADNLAVADETLVGDAIPALISMASPPRLLLGDMERRPHAEPLVRTYKAFPNAVEKALAVLLEGDPYDIGLAARAIALLTDCDKKLPSRFARSLIAKLTRDRRLLQASEHYAGDGDGETVAELRQVLGIALTAQPVETDKLLKAFLAGASEPAEARILSVYREALHPPQFDEEVEVTEAGRLAFSRIVWHATETASHTVLHEIEGFLSGRPWGFDQTCHRAGPTSDRSCYHHPRSTTKSIRSASDRRPTRRCRDEPDATSRPDEEPATKPHPLGCRGGW